MKAKYKVILAIIIVLAAAALTALYVSSSNVEVLNPKGLIAKKQKDLIITVALLMMIVVVPVFVFTIYFAYKYRENNDKARHEPDWEHNNIAELCWWGVPFIIIVILAVITWRTTHELNPFKPLDNEKQAINVQAVALEWKWLFIYPDQGIATVNYLQIPEKTPINFEVTADAPMNSFWIPQLGGQIYAMPGMRAKLHLIADETGTYRGLSANFSGKGFAGMKFVTKSTSESDFYAWVNEVKGSKQQLTIAEYEKLVKPSSYVPKILFGSFYEGLFDWIVLKYEQPSKVYH